MYVMLLWAWSGSVARVGSSEEAAGWGWRDEGEAGVLRFESAGRLASLERTSLRRWKLLDGLDEWCFGTGSEGRRASVSCTVRMCFASASERVKERSHSGRR